MSDHRIGSKVCSLLAGKRVKVDGIEYMHLSLTKEVGYFNGTDRSLQRMSIEDFIDMLVDNAIMNWKEEGV